MRRTLSWMAVAFILTLGIVACTVEEEEEATPTRTAAAPATATVTRSPTPDPAGVTGSPTPDTASLTESPVPDPASVTGSPTPDTAGATESPARDTAGATESPAPDPTPGVLSTCRSFSEGRSEATIIASGILSRESQQLLFDSQKFAALSEELERVLGLIRDAYPATASIHARDLYVAGQIALGVESPLKEAIQSAAARPDDAPFVTGQADFDALNAQLGGVRGVRLSHYYEESSYLALCLDDRVNVVPASHAYLELEGVSSAYPNWFGGDGPDVDALRDGDTWYIVFRDAWGDCPAGCMEQELMNFTVTGDTVVAVESSQAEADPNFASLARWVDGHEIVGIGVYRGQNPVTGEFVIVAPLVDSPAQRAGVRPGDVILAFDGKPTSGWTEDDFRARLGGYEGTDVILSVRHSDGSLEDISFVRAAVPYHAPAQAERIGVEMLADTATGVIVVNPTPNFPADPTVIRWGDLLLAVNGESTANWTAIEAADLIDSIQGDHVTLTVRHIEGGIEDITVSTRAELCPTVPIPVYKGVVYLNGDVAPAGSTVSAVQGGTALMTAIVGDGGRYELALVRNIPPCLSDDPVFFRWEGHGAVSWDDLMADESVVDLSPGPHELNLTFQN